MIPQSRKILLTTLIYMASLLCHTGNAGISIITHPSNSNSLTPEQIRKIYLGKIKTFPNGIRASRACLPNKNHTRSTFLKIVVRKSESSLNSYWVRQLFSSKSKPPVIMKNEQAMKTWIANNIEGIGYIDSSLVDNSVSVIYQYD